MSSNHKEAKLGKAELVKDIQSLGINRGDIVNVKISLKSIGFIDGGAKTLLDAFLEVLGPEGTIISEAFIKMYPLSKLKKTRAFISSPESPSYTGAFTNEMLRRPEAALNLHPTHRYVAIGKNAEQLLANHNVEHDPYLVLERIADAGGKNLRIGPKEKVVGVGTTHIAINKLKYRQKRPKTGIYFYDENKNLKLFTNWWATGCEEAFNNLLDVFHTKGAVLGSGNIGSGESLLTSMKGTLDIEMSLFKEDKKNILCEDPGCPKCRIAWEFSDKKYLSAFIHNLKNRNPKKALAVIYYMFNKNYLPAK